MRFQDLIVIGVILIVVTFLGGCGGSSATGKLVNEQSVQTTTEHSQMSPEDLTVVAMPFEYIVAALLYFDLRFKQEGLDIELNLAKAADPSTDDESVASANTTY